MANTNHITSGRKLRSSYITTTISIALVLFLLGIIGLLLLNAQRLSTYVKENIGFTVLIKDNAREAEVKRLEKLLSTSPFIKQTQYIDKDRAADELKNELGEDFVEFLGYNPLLSSIDVKLFAEYANPDSLVKVEEVIMEFPQVKEVIYQKNLIHLVHQNVRRIALILSGFALMLLLIAVALINNTIRLSVYSKRFIIRTMQLVGATKSFIRRPILWGSVLHGFVGAVLAISLLAILIYFSSQELAGVIGFNNMDLILVLFGIVIALGIFITLISTFFAVNKYLNLRTDDLYF
ncbi:permease-like cell division protein FtsX [Carboxylicivirga mesophila]|uniref:Cell division protein FtsX n=1 Tax=Carboxylicivirga mesophila TaxID=1166478 RepID=A0ABS5KC76_9BACT|nr:permease-like cell division protein FtsX [Carboxylicivirga mesophila]MBS2212590.1 permease-like cell division protein FtsX [Carboxylicivirga mesophila]